MKHIICVIFMACSTASVSDELLYFPPNTLGQISADSNFQKLVKKGYVIQSDQVGAPPIAQIISPNSIGNELYYDIVLNNMKRHGVVLPSNLLKDNTGSFAVPDIGANCIYMIPPPENCKFPSLIDTTQPRSKPIGAFGASKYDDSLCFAAIPPPSWCFDHGRPDADNTGYTGSYIPIDSRLSAAVTATLSASSTDSSSSTTDKEEWSRKYDEEHKVEKLTMPEKVYENQKEADWKWEQYDKKK